MKKDLVRVGDRTYPLHSLNTLIVGSGAAALNAAVHLHEAGQTSVAIVTDRLGAGASAESGSDKQTYYKVGLAAGEPDSPLAMAEDLAAGGAVHGDIALCEALGSARAFFRLVELGVAFPHDRYGGFVGYKTDHDPRRRATSAGPLTSRQMFEALAAETARRRIPILEGHEVVSLLVAGCGRERRVVGAAALDRRRLGGPGRGIVLFNAVNVVLGTGGPGGMYAHSVYPEDQLGSHGLAFAVGASAHNLTESQFGLASTAFRWNLSGSYQQVIPRYISANRAGGDEREFLADVFPDLGRLATAVFLKGYQWPFDPRKVADFGSSLVDLAVYRETVVRGRRVFLDFRANPGGGGRLGPFSLERLAPEALAYLRRSGAIQETPIARLRRLNPPAVELYANHGIDLAREPLEAAVCAQHSNGGFKVDLWWESDVRGLFPVGEAAGTHGVTRPGGSALNAGQVGSQRAALYISRRAAAAPPSKRTFVSAAGAQIRDLAAAADAMIDPRHGTMLAAAEAVREIRDRMSACGGVVRRPGEVREETKNAWALFGRLRRELRVPSSHGLPAAFKVLDLALVHAMYLEAIREYLDRGGKSRGSFIVPDPAGVPPGPGFDDGWRFSLAAPEEEANRKILEIRFLGPGQAPERKGARTVWVEPRPIPREDAWFENVWREFREDRIVRKGVRS
jgi:succinate dehydrogenase/fumarate reductase flavoprotein subunit